MNINIDHRLARQFTAFSPWHNTNLISINHNSATWVTVTGTSSGPTSTEHIVWYSLSVCQLALPLWQYRYLYLLKVQWDFTTFCCSAPSWDSSYPSRLHRTAGQSNGLHIWPYLKWSGNLYVIIKAQH
jgi:hypothetical protein